MKLLLLVPLIFIILIAQCLFLFMYNILTFPSLVELDRSTTWKSLGVTVGYRIVGLTILGKITWGRLNYITFFYIYILSLLERSYPSLYPSESLGPTYSYNFLIYYIFLSLLLFYIASFFISLVSFFIRAIYCFSFSEIMFFIYEIVFVWLMFEIFTARAILSAN